LTWLTASLRIVTISVVLAVAISLVALWLTFHFRGERKSGGWRKNLSALIMGAAIREKEKSSGRHVPIIAMTANALTGDQERCLAAGLDGYVSKPIRTKELFAAIEGFLERTDEVHDLQDVETEPKLIQ
jgi:hypothetical protein